MSGAGVRADAPYTGSKDYLADFSKRMGLDGRYYSVEDRHFKVQNILTRHSENTIILEKTRLAEAYDVSNLFLTIWLRIAVRQVPIKDRSGEVIGYEE